MRLAKSPQGNFFENFSRGQLLRHPVPRTVTEGDAALYVALYGDRRALSSSREFARALGFRGQTIHDWLAFHIVFGKSVGQVSRNAVANLGYADGRFLRPVYAGDTLRAESEVLGLKETSNGKSGIVWVRTRGINQRDEEVLRYCRWVMVEKREPGRMTGAADTPTLPHAVPATELRAPEELDLRRFPEVAWATGGNAYWDDYEPGVTIDHQDGMTVDEADHTCATRLYQNTARVHFDLYRMASSRFGKRLVYGGHVISIASALQVNGFENALGVLALNGGSHSNPTFAGDTIVASTEVLEKAPLAGRDDAGALRVRLCAAKAQGQEVGHDPVLELDLWLLVPRRR